MLIYPPCLCPEYITEEEVKPLIKEQHECVCEGSSCATGNRCMGHQCFSSLTVSAGTLMYQKGCFKIYEQSTLTCKTPPSRDQIVECCHGHLCNLNSTVELPVKGTVLYCKIDPLSVSFMQRCSRAPSIDFSIELAFRAGMIMLISYYYFR